jgi:hypothetical protein
MATTTAFSGFGFVPSGGADCCTCEEPTPCVQCSIECVFDSTTYHLPEYYWLDITVDSSPNCCGGEWASGCHLLRNAQFIFGSGTDSETGKPNCLIYYAVDPDNVDDVLFAPAGYYDETAEEGICGVGLSDTPLIRGIVSSDSLLVTYTIAEIDAPNSTPTSWTNFNNYEYSSSPSDITDFCAAPFTLAKGSGFVSCWETDEFPTPPNNTAWPATATLTAADCESPRDCQFNFTPDPCAWLDGPYETLIVQGTLAGVAIKVCLSFEEGSPDNWNGVQIVDLGCGDVELLLKLYCVSPDWFLEVWIDGVLIDTLDVTIDDPLGTTGTVSDFLSPVCGGSEAMVASIDPCAGDLPFADCCDPETYNMCCLPESIPTEGQLDNATGCDCVLSSGSMGYAYGDPLDSLSNPLFGGDRWYWVGDTPLDDGFGQLGKIYLSCNGGSVEVHHTDSANNDYGNLPTWVGTFCPTPIGTITLNYPSDGCCPGGGGIFKVAVG